MLDLNSQKLILDQFNWGLSGQIVRSISPHTEAHPMALLSQLITTYGAMVGKGPYFSAEADRHQTNLFVLNVGNSSKGRKGSSWGQIKRLFQMVDPDWLERSLTNGFGSGEALTWMLSQADNLALLPPSSNVQPTKNILIMESEFGSLLKIVNKEGNTTSPVMRNAWDGTTLRNITKGAHVQVSDHHVSAIGHITKTELLQLLKQTEVMNGLANRFLFFFVERSKKLPFGSEVPAEDLKMMADELKCSIDFGRQQRLMKRSSEANRLWAQVYEEISEGLAGIVGSLSNRSEAQVMRLAMILSLMNRQKEISREALESAIAIHEYCIKTLQYIFGSKTGVLLADKLAEYIKEHEQGVTRTEIRDYLNRNHSKEIVNDAINLLLESKIIITVDVLRSGKTVKIYMENRRSDDLGGTQNDINDQSMGQMSSMSSSVERI